MGNIVKVKCNKLEITSRREMILKNRCLCIQKEEILKEWKKKRKVVWSLRGRHLYPLLSVLPYDSHPNIWPHNIFTLKNRAQTFEIHTNWTTNICSTNSISQGPNLVIIIDGFWYLHIRLCVWFSTGFLFSSIIFSVTNSE